MLLTQFLSNIWSIQTYRLSLQASHVHGFSSRWLAAAAAAIAMIGNAEFSSNWTISSCNKITNFIWHWNSTWRAYILLIRKQAIQMGGIGGEARGRSSGESSLIHNFLPFVWCWKQCASTCWHTSLGCGADHPPPSKCRGHERVELYTSTHPLGLCGLLQGEPLPLSPLTRITSKQRVVHCTLYSSATENEDTISWKLLFTLSSGQGLLLYT